MNASFRAASIESHFSQQSRTVTSSRNTFQETSQENVAREDPQGLLLHHTSPEQGYQPTQDPENRQLASSSNSPTLSRFSYDSLEQLPVSADYQHQEGGKVQGQKISNIYGQLFTLWKMEIVSFGIAFLCLAAIFGILFMHRGLPLPQWPLNITINALIAVFTAIFKMALLVPVADGISQFKWLWFLRPRELADIERLDRASRGAWGSFLFLFSRVPTLDRSWLASLGALITIAGLAIDPFSQQIIQSDSCLRNITGATAEIPIIQDSYGRNLVQPEYNDRLSGSLQLTTIMGLLSPPPNSSAAIVTNCPTGNCTFPSDGGATFSTLATCHSCVDISHTIAYLKSDPREDSLTPTLPSGARLDGIGTMLASTKTLNEDFRSLFSFEAIMRRDIDNRFDDFAVACRIAPCLKTFSANVTNGVYQERELSSLELVWKGINQNLIGLGYSLASNRTLRNGTWQPCMPTAQNTTVNTIKVTTNTMSRAVGPLGEFEHILWYPEECVWNLDQSAARGFSWLLTGFLHGKNLSINDEDNWEPSKPSNMDGDLWLLRLYRNGTANIDTISAFMDGLAWSLTAGMRQAPIAAGNFPQTLNAVSGQMQGVQTCLSVRWVWLSLPASLLGLQMVFLVALIVISGSGNYWYGDWKDSSLALLYHGIEGSASKPDEYIGGEELRDREGMFKVAQKMKVQLRQVKDDWRFRTV